MACNCDFPSYAEFRTGLTFKEVRQGLAREQKARYEKGQYMFITRHTVLGRWHQLKQEMYKQEEIWHDQICNDQSN